MTTLVFEIYGVDANASETFKKIAAAADDAGLRIKDTGDKTDESGKKASSSSTMFAGLTSGWAALIPVAVPLGSAILNLSGVLGLVPAAAAFAGASLLTLKLGFQGITEAIGLFNTAQTAQETQGAQIAAQQLAAANAAISADNAVKASKVSLADTIRNTANANISASEAVGNAQQALDGAYRTSALNNVMALQSEQRAEESLTNAQHAAQRAQQSLTDARESAKRSLEDAATRVTDVSLAQRSAVEQLENAQRALTTSVGPNQAPKDMEALQLAVDQAQQQVAKLGVEYTRAQEDAQKATDKGIEGSSQVVNAQDAVTSSVAAQRQAQTALGDAQAKVTEANRSGLQSIGDAQQKLGDATRAQQQAAITGAENVTKANLAVDAALRAQQQTLAQNKAAADSAAGSLSAYNAALAELSPNARAVVVAITGMREQWQNLQQAVSQRMFAGIADDIRNLAGTWLPILQTGLVGIAGGFNTAFQGIAAWLSQKDTVAQFRQIFADFGVTAQNLGAAMRPIMQIFGDLLSVGASFLPGLSKGFADGAQSVADFVRNAKDTGQLKAWMQTGLDTLGQIWAILKDLGGIVKDLFGGANASSGSGFLATIKEITGTVRWLLDNFPILGPIIGIALGVAGLIGFAEKLGIIKGITVVLGAVFSEAGIAMLAALWPVLLPIAAIGGAAYLVWKYWEPISGFFKGLWNDITNAFWAALRIFTDGWNQLTNGFYAAWNGVTGFFRDIWRGIVNVFWGGLHAFTDGIGQMWNVGRDIVVGLWNGIAGAARWLWDQITGWLGNIWSGIKGFFHISSPSGLMAEAGQSIAEGLAMGITSSAASAVNAATVLASGVKGALTGIAASASLTTSGSGSVALTGLPASVVALPSPQTQQVQGLAQQGPQTVNVNLSITANDSQAAQFILAAVRNAVRDAGGVTAALGPVA